MIGRWLSPDPYAQHWSPYLAMSNNPISFIDPDGGQDDPYSQEWHDGSNMWWAHVGPTSRIYEELGVDGISFSRHSLTGNNGTVYSSWDKGTIQKIETALYMYALTGTFHRIATFKKLDGTDEEGKYTGNSYKLGGPASQVATRPSQRLAAYNRVVENFNNQFWDAFYSYTENSDGLKILAKDVEESIDNTLTTMAGAWSIYSGLPNDSGEDILQAADDIASTAKEAVAGNKTAQGTLIGMAAIVVVDFILQKKPLYRGGSSLVPRKGIDYNIDANGFVKERGISLNSDKMNPFVQKYGGAFEVDLESIPDGLKLKHTGGTHYELVPSRNMTETEYLNLMKQVELLPTNTIRP